MSAQVCYTPAGVSRNAVANATEGWLYAPCSNTAAVSMCCAIGPGRDGSQDRCLDNGLCSNDILCDGCVWRESCTDPTWQDPACIKLFVNGTGLNATMGTTVDKNNQTINDVEVWKCDNGSFCYGEINTGCCQAGEGVFIYNGEQVTFNPNATTTTSISARPTSSVTQSSSPSPSPSNTSSGGLSTGAKAGIGVGASLGGLFLIALVFWCFRRNAKRSREGHHQRQELPYETSRPELGPSEPRHEMVASPGFRSPSGGMQELDGSTEWSGSREDFVKKKIRQRGTHEHGIGSSCRGAQDSTTTASEFTFSGHSA